MKPGQRLTRWWQEYVLGRLTTPQAIVAAARAENPDRVEDRFTETPEDNPQWDTPERLKAPAFLTSASYAAQQQRADWQQCDPRLKLWAARLVLRAAKLGIPLFVHCALRTKAEQDRLRREGFSKLAWPNGAHNIGEAVDIIHGRYAWELTDREWLFIHWLGQDELRKINATLPKARKLGLNWGGNDHTKSDRFKWDPAHWEILDYRDRIRALPTGAPVHVSPTVIVATLK